MTTCTARFVTGYRAFTPCTHPATAIVNTQYAEPFLVCGYHARAYAPKAVYPLSWSLAAIRRWQLQNVDDLPAWKATP